MIPGLPGWPNLLLAAGVVRHLQRSSEIARATSISTIAGPVFTSAPRGSIQSSGVSMAATEHVKKRHADTSHKAGTRRPADGDGEADTDVHQAADDCCCICSSIAETVRDQDVAAAGLKETVSAMPPDTHQKMASTMIISALSEIQTGEPDAPARSADTTNIRPECRGTIPVSAIHRDGSPVTPRRISAIAVERTGGRHPAAQPHRLLLRQDRAECAAERCAHGFPCQASGAAHSRRHLR